MTTQSFAASLKALTMDTRKRKADALAEKKQKILSTIMEEIRKQAKHAAKKDCQEFVGVDFPNYKQDDDEVRNIITGNLAPLLIAEGFNGREIAWTYPAGDIALQQEVGRHLRVTVSWDEPLSPRDIRDLLSPAQQAAS